MTSHRMIDLRELFELPARQIEFPEADRTGISNSRSQETGFTYCPVKLKKLMGQRFNDDEDEGLGLDYADGFECIEPDTAMQGLLADLQYSEERPNECEFLLVVAMYNEGVEQFKNTMKGVANNLQTFVKYGIHPRKIACCLIIDGIRPFFATLSGEKNKGTKRFFNQFFNEELITERFGVSQAIDCKLPFEEEHDEFAHVFMQNVCLDETKRFPLQFFFTIKQKNKRKLNTHLWFFGGFCEMIQPKFVMLLDVGTRPLKNSLFYLYEAMKLDNRLAGCCGEIKPMNPTIWKLVVPAQEVEYKFSHIFDKALESVIGYITVLPGAFSAYRWEALQGSPLWTDYFKSICHPEEMGPFNSNIYLAEDRVLCLSLVSKRKAAYTLRYVRSSVAETDVPESIAELMSQRRRWINGSWFALIDSLKNFKSVFASDHSCCRKFVFSLQMLYYYVTVIFSWFMVGSFYMVFAITMQTQWGGSVGSFGSWLVGLYAALLLVIYTLALSVKPRRVDSLYRVVASVFGIYMLLGFYLTVTYLFIGGDGSKDWARFTILTTFCLFICNILANCCLSAIARGLLHFLFMIPTYVNIFLIYAICNTHDCSWGNRPDKMTPEELKRVEEFEEFRSRWTIIWALSNAAFGIGLTRLSQADNDGWYVYAIAVTGMLILMLRTLGGLIYLCQEKYCRGKLKKDKQYGLYSQFKPQNDVRYKSVVSPMTGFADAQPPPVMNPEFESISSIQDESGTYRETTNSEESGENTFLGLLRYAIDDLEFSISHIADEAGLDASRLRDIEQGLTLPTDSEVERLVHVLKDVNESK